MGVRLVRLIVGMVIVEPTYCTYNDDKVAPINSKGTVPSNLAQPHVHVLANPQDVGHLSRVDCTVQHFVTGKAARRKWLTLAIARV